MPYPKTYGDLEADVDRLDRKIEKTIKALEARRAYLADLKGKIANKTKTEGLDANDGSDSMQVDRTEILNSIVNPEDIWPC